MQALNSLLRACSLICTGARSLQGQLHSSAALREQLSDLTCPSTLRMHASCCVDSIRADSAICAEDQITQVPLLDMLPRFSHSDVSISGTTYDTEERYRIEGGGLVCGRPALVKVVSLAADQDAVEHVLNEVCSNNLG